MGPGIHFSDATSMAPYPLALLPASGHPAFASRQLPEPLTVSQARLLTEARTLASRRQAQGGLTLAQDADLIQSIDAYEAADAPLVVERAPHCGLGVAPSCPLSDLLGSPDEQMRQCLESMTAADLAAASTAVRPCWRGCRHG
jgi:DNA-binding IscR family transcriptional regulator